MFKKLMVVLSVGLLVTSMGTAVFAEDGTVFNESSVEEIKFRDIDWYSTFYDTDQILRNSDTAISWLFYDNDNSTVKGIDPEDPSNDYFYGDSEYRVDDGGWYFWYQDVPVSNYTSDLTIYTMYDISSGNVDKERDHSLFYKAEYTIEDLADPISAYDDLKNKLTGLYGEPRNVNQTDWDGEIQPVSVWEAQDGSQVVLYLYINSLDESQSELHLIYAAPDLNSRVKMLKDKLQSDAVASEGQAREENQSNTDGL